MLERHHVPEQHPEQHFFYLTIQKHEDMARAARHSA